MFGFAHIIYCIHKPANGLRVEPWKGFPIGDLCCSCLKKSYFSESESGSLISIAFLVAPGISQCGIRLV